jgi:hypothetical protein
MALVMLLGVPMLKNTREKCAGKLDPVAAALVHAMTDTVVNTERLVRQQRIGANHEIRKDPGSP